ncbi:hypothetical protein ACQ4PT_025142 [Festuca glaucescens]
MEGRSSTPRAAAAALVKNTGVSEADVVPGGGSRRGAGASGSGLVPKAADQEEHGVGGATLPDLNVHLKAEDTLVGETSSVRKRKFDELDDSEDSAHAYISSDIEPGEAVSYNSAASDASSEAEVTKYNELSYEKKVEEKIWEEGLSAYMKNDGKYFCKFHPFKKFVNQYIISSYDDVKLCPGIMGNADFDSFCMFPNLVEMDDEQLARVKRVVLKHKPSKPLYVFTIKKSNIIKGKAKMIDENITEEYRMQEAVVPDPVPARQEKAKSASALPKKKQAPKPIDNDQMEFLINRLMGYLDQQLHKLLAPIPSLCAQRTLEMFNKEDANSFQNGPRDKKEFMYKEESDSEGGRARVCSIVDMTLPDEGEEHGTHVKKPAENGTSKNANDAMRTPAKASGLNGHTPDKPFGDLGSTPDNPFIIDNVDPVTSDFEIDIDAVTISKFISKAKEDELVGKRKRTIPKKIQSPYALDRRTKRQVRGSSTKALNFDDKPGPDKNSKLDASTDLTPELVDAAIVFLELASRWLSDDVIDGYIGHLALHVGHDRFLYPAWRSKYLVDRANAGDKPQDSSKNMDSAMLRSGVVGRVLAEYTVRDKVYFPLNIGNTHWMTVVMHIPKQEFQVLDSLYPLDFTLETV